MGLQPPLGVPRWAQAQCWKPSGWRPSCCWLLLVHKGICRSPKGNLGMGAPSPGAAEVVAVVQAPGHCDLGGGGDPILCLQGAVVAWRAPAAPSPGRPCSPRGKSHISLSQGRCEHSELWGFRPAAPCPCGPRGGHEEGTRGGPWPPPHNRARQPRPGAAKASEESHFIYPLTC